MFKSKNDMMLSQQIKKMRRSQKPSIVSKSNQTVGVTSFLENESLEFINFQNQNQQDDQIFGKSHYDKPELQSKNPNSERPWNLEDEIQLIQLHKQFGNKWTLLAGHYNGMDENSIKNRFYSRLRKSIRKLNKAIGLLELKKYNKFKLNIIFKLSNISEGKMAQKQKIVPQIFQFYREFLYQLIQYSQENQNVLLSNQLLNTADVQNLILPLIALENLFRIVRGERVAKGKKKNIAYLRQFSFRLSLQNFSEMVITKEHILLVNGNQNSGLLLNSNTLVQGNQRMIAQKDLAMSRETQHSLNREFQNLEFGRRRGSLDIQEQDSVMQRSMSPFKESEDADCNTRSQMWKDYFGHEMKEYDICGQGEANMDQGNQFGLYSFKSSNFIDENIMW